MNKQEIKRAVKILGNFISDETHRRKYDKETVIELSNALITLKEIVENQLTNGWIPVSERLPNKDGYYLVSCKGGNVIIDFFWDNNRDSELKNTWENKYCYEILAWRERPKHYTDLEEVFDRR